MQTDSTHDHARMMRRLFDRLAPDYDRSGVAFFQPIAARLSELAGAGPGQRAIDLGCGRGAVALALARAVGAGGSVVAADISPAMVRGTVAESASAGLANVHPVVLDAMSPAVRGAVFDVVASSLVLQLLPYPRRALGSWLHLLAPGGRLAISTLGRSDRVLASMVGALRRASRPGAPPEVGVGPLGDEQALHETLVAAGAGAVRVIREPLTIALPDAQAWRRWTMTTGDRMYWSSLPLSQQQEVCRQADEALATAPRADGVPVVRQEILYTVATGAPA